MTGWGTRSTLAAFRSDSMDQSFLEAAVNSAVCRTFSTAPPTRYFRATRHLAHGLEVDHRTTNEMGFVGGT